MTPGTGSDRSLESPNPTADDIRRRPLQIAAVVLLVGCLVPPCSSYARRYEFVEALQFSLLAAVIPALVVAGSPWRLLGLAARRPPEATRVDWPPGRRQLMDELAHDRRRRPGILRSVVFGSLFLVVVTLWRIPPSVNALARHPWLVGVEAVTLVVAGVGLWLELIESPPLSPRLSRPKRAALAAVSMWVVWILAYLVGFSHGSWYVAYSHQAGHGFSLAADQQLTAGTMWIAFGGAFIPVIFSNLIRWLQSEEDPDDAMQALVRLERTRGRTSGQTSL